MAAPNAPSGRLDAVPDRSHPRSARVIATLTGAMFLLSSGVAVARTDHHRDKPALAAKNASSARVVTPRSADDAAAAAAMSSLAWPRPASKPFAGGRFTPSCGYRLADVTDPTTDGPLLLAQVQLRSTSSESVHAKVTVGWSQVIRPAITRTLVVSLPGKQVRTVDFTVPVSEDSLELFASSDRPTVCVVRVATVH